MDQQQISKIRSFIWELSRKKSPSKDDVEEAVQIIRTLLDSGIAMQRKMFRLRYRLREQKGESNE